MSITETVQPDETQRSQIPTVVGELHVFRVRLQLEGWRAKEKGALRTLQGKHIVIKTVLLGRRCGVSDKEEEKEIEEKGDVRVRLRGGKPKEIRGNISFTVALD